LLLAANFTFSQVIFRDQPDDFQSTPPEKLFNLVATNSQFISLNGKWEISPVGNPEKQFVINVPSIFEGEGSFVYKKKFNLTPEQISNSKIELFFSGLNYLADIAVNKALIYRHTGGDLPFSVSLPRDILLSDKENILQITLHYEITPETTIPVNKRFLFPKNFGGIFRDVYLKLSPVVNIQSLDVRTNIDFANNKAKVEFLSLIENREFQSINDTLPSNQNNFSLKIQIFSPDFKNVIANDEKFFQLNRNKEINLRSILTISSPLFWTPDYPVSYPTKIQIQRNDETLSEYSYSVALFELKAKDEFITLNNKPFRFVGVTYVPTLNNYGPLVSYKQVENDIKKIKSSGFNSIRFIKSIPPQYVFKLCEIYGLIPIVDLPLADVPEGLAASANFIVRVKNYTQLLLKAFNEYSLFSVINLGSSYLSNSEKINSFVSELSTYIKQRKPLLVSASFMNKDLQKINAVDLYGIEIINNSVYNQTRELDYLQQKVGKGRLYFSEATYTISFGQSDGYANKFTYESQAKFFEDLLNYSENNFSGYFINSIFDYRGDFASLLFKFDKDNIYKLGLISEDRKEERIAYKVVTSYIQNTERVTIPIGTSKDDSPMVFIIMGLFLALFMAVLVNSGKKFREDATRSLLRPYNFFADIRDQRIISGYQSIFLLIIICFTISLIASNLLYYFRNNLFVEKLVLASGSKFLMSAISYFAWNPINSIIWLFVISLFIVFILMIVIKSAAFFVRNKVYVSSVFFVIVWSYLPTVLFIPAGIVLYRILNTELFNSYIYIFLIFIKVWLLFRLIKGIYVIYDVNPAPVYFYSFLLIITILTVFILYFDFNYSIVDNLLLVIKQFRVI
jgi:beta-galactosidase